MSDTKTDIVRVAESLFASHGFKATSIRMIVTQAGVNLGAIHYHFGSKEALFLEVLRGRLEFLGNERRRRLTEAQAKSGVKLSIRQIVEAFMLPILTVDDGGPASNQFVVMMARAFSESPEVKKQVFERFFQTTCQDFIAAMSTALPRRPPVDIYYRFHFMIGSMVGTLMAPDRVDLISGGQNSSMDIEDTVHRLIDFIVAGMLEGSDDDR